MRMFSVLVICLMFSLFPVDRAEAFAAAPQQMKSELDNAFKKQNEEFLKAAQRQAALEAAEKRAKEEKEKSAKQMKTAMFWGIGMFAGFVGFRKLRS